MSDKTDKDRQEEQAQAVDAFATATAVGFAVASRSMEMWFGMMSGFARASREIMAPHLEAQMRDLDKAAPEDKVPAAPEAEAPSAPVEDSAHVVELAPRWKKAAPAAKPSVAATVAQPVVEKRAPKAIDRPKTVDDLKRIAGIGPKLEQILNGFGVWTFDQIAALQAEEIAWLDDTLGLNGRIDADSWLGQASSLGRAGTQNKDVAAG